MANVGQSETPKTYGPYSPVRQVGDTFYISGQVGVNPVSKTASEAVTDQVDQAIKNLGVVLASAGLDYDDVIKTTLYLTDISMFTQVNSIYLLYFNEPRPARTTVGIAELPRVGGDAKLVFEIDAVAVKKRP